VSKLLRKEKNIKQVHGIIDERCLRPLAHVSGVQKVVPGEIASRGKTSAIKAGLYFQRLLPHGLKLAIKKNMYVQDVFVVADLAKLDRKALVKCLLNPQKIPETFL
jgi:hypothetical protein